MLGNILSTFVVCGLSLDHELICLLCSLLGTFKFAMKVKFSISCILQCCQGLVCCWPHFFCFEISKKRKFNSYLWSSRCEVKASVSTVTPMIFKNAIVSQVEAQLSYEIDLIILRDLTGLTAYVTVLSRYCTCADLCCDSRVSCCDYPCNVIIFWSFWHGTVYLITACHAVHV